MQRSAGRAAGWNSEAPSGQDRDCSLPLHANASYISAAYPCSIHSHDAQHKIIFVCASADTHQTSKQNVEPVNKSLETWNGPEYEVLHTFYSAMERPWSWTSRDCHLSWPWTRRRVWSASIRRAPGVVPGVGLVSQKRKLKQIAL